MQDFQGIGVPSFGFSGFGINVGVLTVLFYLTVLLVLIFTLMLFKHWRKYSPSPLRALKYGLIYTIGTIVLVLLLLSLLPIYSLLFP